MNLRGLESLKAVLARRRVEVKTAGELEAMRAAGLIVYDVLTRVSGAIAAGVTTADLDELAEQTIRDAGAVPSFKGYRGFPASICASVNDQIVHGIPRKTTVLAAGDLISVDCGAILDGWHGDAAITASVGKASPQDAALSAATEAAMWAGIRAAKVGAKLTDISYAIQNSAEVSAAVDDVDYGQVDGYGGHGIGRQMHMEPFLPNTGKPGKGPRLRPGMTLAIEPMLTSGTDESLELDDGWTVITTDGSRAAHWEHTVAITESGPRVLTAAEGADYV